MSFGEGETVDAEIVVMSIGRAPVTHGLGLAATNVQVDGRGFIVVDENLRTAEPNVFAAGDVVDTAQLAHIGFAEGMQIIKQILGEPASPIDYNTVPWCIYTHPEVAFAGMTEEQAKEAGFDVVVDKHRFAGNGRAMIVGETEGLVKIIAEKKRRRSRRPHSWCSYGWPLGHRTTWSGVLGCELGGDRRRDRCLHPAPPDH